MAINIQSLFSDIIETPAQRQERMLTEGILRGRELTGGLTGLARTQAPLVAALSTQMPQRQEALRRSAGGMLGIEDMSPSAVAQRIIKDIDPSNVESMVMGAKALSDAGLGVQAAQLRGMAAEQKRKQQEDLRSQQEFALGYAGAIQDIDERERARLAAISNADAQQRYRDQIADLAANSEQYSQFAAGIRSGSVPQERLEKIVDDLTERPDPSKLNIVQGFVDGKHMTLNSDGFGNFYTLDGNKISLSENDKVAPASATGTFEDVAGLSERQRNQLSEIQIQTSNFISTANNMIDFLKENPSANTITSQIASIGNDILAEATAVASAINPDVSTSISDYENVFSEFAIQGDRFKAGILGVALQYAAASGLGENRSLTDTDVTRAIRAIGSSKSDPNSIIEVLNDRKQELITKHNNVYYFLTGDVYENSLDPLASRPSDSLFN